MSGKSLFDINSRFRSGMARSRLGETTSKWRQFYDEVLEDPNIIEMPDTMKVLTFNGEQHGTLFSAIIHLCKVGKVAGYFVHVVEGSSDPLEPMVARRDSIDIKLQPVCAQTVDATYLAKVHEHVVTQSGVADPRYAGFSVILTTQTPSKDTAIPFVFTAVAAIDSKLTEELGGPVFNLANEVDTDKDILRAQIKYDAEPVPDMNDLPVRSDVSVVISGTKKSEKTNTPHAQKVLARIDAYVDLVLDPEATMGGNQFMQPLAYGQRPTARFVPRIVVTRAEVNFNFITLETQLFQLALANFLHKNNFYMGVWRPRRALKASEDWRDIGALNYEVRLVGDPKRPDARVKIDTKNETTFSDASAYQFMQACISPLPIYSLDVELGGANYAIQQKFVEAANNTGTARADIIAAANKLTNNNFSGLYKGDGSLFYLDNNSIDIGYYVDAHGNRQDLRNIDHLAMLNMFGESNMELVDRHAATYDDDSVDMDIRLHRRRDCQMSAVGTPVIRNRAIRLNIEPRFMQALGEACNKTGLKITPNNMSMEYGSGIRGRANVRTFMMNTDTTSSGLFSGTDYGDFNRNSW